MWQEILFTLLVTIIGIVSAWGMTLLKTWLADKLADKKTGKFILEILEITERAVKATYQTYVESLKGTDAWTKEAQEKALKLALDEILAELSDDTKAYIESNYGNVSKYLTQVIEAVLYDLKKSK